jgi:hypothetical protein
LRTKLKLFLSVSCCHSHFAREFNKFYNGGLPNR